MSSFQQSFKGLDPSLLAILDISNTARCCVICKVADEETRATYYKPATGRAQRDPQCDEDLLFQCASLSKVFIATSLILIIDKLSLDPSTKRGYHKLKGAWDKTFTEVYNDVVGPKGKQMRSLPGDPSVLQVLVHYSGVYDINHILLAPDGTPLQGDDDAIDRISQYAKDTGKQQTGEQKRIRYSNANHILLALLIDKASGSLNDFLKENIFTPFKMGRTFLSLEDLHSRSSESQRQPHVVSSDRSRRMFRPDTTLGLFDVVEMAWLGPYISAGDLGRFFEGLLSAKGGKSIGLVDKAVFKSLCSGQSSFNKQSYYTRCGLLTSFNSTGPGSHSLNRLISPDSPLKDHILGKSSSGEEICAFYLAGSATGWAGTVYFLPYKNTFVIVLTNTSGPLDASDIISQLCLHEIFDLQPPKASNRNVSNYLPGRSSRTSAERERNREYYVTLAARIFDENAVKVKELEQLDGQPDTPTSDCPDLPGKYFCARNGQTLRIIDWKGEDNQRTEGVLRAVLQSGMKSSLEFRFTKKGEKFRICSPESSPVLAIDRFGAWRNLELEVERDEAGVKSLSRQGAPLKDFFIQERGVP